MLVNPAPGTALSFDANGVPDPIAVTVSDNSAILSDLQVELVLTPASGSVLTNGHVVVQEREEITVSGLGFAPRSSVEIWAFSNPVVLGTATVDANGSFSSVVELPDDIRPGEHTVQVEGLLPNGTTRALALGIAVQARPIELPVTGGSADLYLQLSLLVTAIGLMMTTRTIRHRLR